MLTWLFKKRTKEEVFWQWFSKRTERYLHFENNQEQLFYSLKKQLEKIDSNLVFEFSKTFNGVREFVISADGIRESFSAVETLVNQAPRLEGWKITAFRQPRLNVDKIKYGDASVNLNEVYFRYSKDIAGSISLELHMKGFYESTEWSSLTFIVLDTVLGEYDAETSLNGIEKVALNETDVTQLLPIRELPNILKQCRLESSN